MLTGAVAAALAQWSRLDDDTQRRLRNVRDDTRATAALLSELQSRGEVIRSRIPVVNDALIGIALANPSLQTPALLPAATATPRPDCKRAVRALSVSRQSSRLSSWVPMGKLMLTS